jgi:integrase
MASITQQPNGKYRAQVYVKGERDTQVFRTQREARAWAAAREEQMRQLRSVPEDQRRTLKQVLCRYLEEVTDKKKGSYFEAMRIRSFVREFPEIAALPLAEVKTPVLAKWRDARLKTVAGSTVNRDINWLRNALLTARDEWHWMTHNPFAGFRFPNDPPPRDRRVTTAEIKAICRACHYVTGRPPISKKQEVAYAFLIALRTSMRMSEILTLGSDNVDLKKRTATLAHKMQYLTGKPRVVPLTRHAARLMKPLAGNARFFTLTAVTLDTIFRTARARLAVTMPEIATLHFHDTRAESLTRLSRKVDVMTLAKISGHKDLSILQNTYYRESAEDIAARL